MGGKGRCGRSIHPSAASGLAGEAEAAEHGDLLRELQGRRLGLLWQPGGDLHAGFQDLCGQGGGLQIYAGLGRHLPVGSARGAEEEQEVRATLLELFGTGHASAEIREGVGRVLGHYSEGDSGGRVSRTLVNLSSTCSRGSREPAAARAGIGNGAWLCLWLRLILCGVEN